MCVCVCVCRGEVEGSLTKCSADCAVTDRFRMHRSAEMSETVNRSDVEERADPLKGVVWYLHL